MSIEDCLAACALVLAVAVIPTLAVADEDDPSQIEVARAQASELQKQGAALSKQKDYAGALDKFQHAYAIVPSPKILKNIAQTQLDLKHDADAANAYQRYLDDPGSDSALRGDLTKILARLDAGLGTLVVTASPANVEISIDGWNPPWLVPGDAPVWLPVAQVGRVRVAPGAFTVRARKPGFIAGEVAGSASASTKQPVDLRLVAEVIVVDEGDGGTIVGVVEPPPGDDDGDEIEDLPPPARATRVQLGALVDLAIDGKGEGVAILPGVSVRIADRVEIAAKALLGGSAGAYLGATLYLTTGRFRPQLSAGVPVFFSNGARVGARGGAGLSIELGARLSAVIELGAEYFVNPEMDRHDFVVVPIVGAHARL